MLTLTHPLEAMVKKFRVKLESAWRKLRNSRSLFQQ